jgi:hypothetical protein
MNNNDRLEFRILLTRLIEVIPMGNPEYLFDAMKALEKWVDEYVVRQLGKL